MAEQLLSLESSGMTSSTQDACRKKLNTVSMTAPREIVNFVSRESQLRRGKHRGSWETTFTLSRGISPALSDLLHSFLRRRKNKQSEKGAKHSR